MEPAGIILAAVGTVDLCLKYGKLLMNKYHDYKHAEEDIGEMVLNIQGSWLKTEIQLESMRKFWESLDPRLQVHFSQVLDQLQSKLQAALAKVDGVTGSSKEGTSGNTLDSKEVKVKRWKAMFLKNSIKQAIQDLEDWQARFDPSWYLITLIADPVIDEHLGEKTPDHSDPTERLKEIREVMRGPANSQQTKRSIFLDGGLIDAEKRPISCSNAYLSRTVDGRGAVIIDCTTYPSDTVMSIATTHVRDLARLLSNVDPWTFGLLCCHGVVKLTDENGAVVQFQFIFAVPPSLKNPRALRDLLLAGELHPLDQRFQLAKQLARSVMFVHTSGFVHKNIRPETTIVFQDYKSVLGPSFLVGFERFRPAAAGTNFRGDKRWETNLYRYPRRQGVLPEDIYVMQHDIYSLGVCLLEIGLWSPFVCPDGESMKPGPELDIADALASKDRVKAAFDIKRTLVSMAKEKLPCRMGSRYTTLVVSCLCCLDSDDTNLFGKGTDLEDEDGIVVGVQYIEKVIQIPAISKFADGEEILLQIEEISV